MGNNVLAYVLNENQPTEHTHLLCVQMESFDDMRFDHLAFCTVVPADYIHDNQQRKVFTRDCSLQNVAICDLLYIHLPLHMPHVESCTVHGNEMAYETQNL